MAASAHAAGRRGRSSTSASRTEPVGSTRQPQPGSGATPRACGADTPATPPRRAGPAGRSRSVANSPDTTPSTSFTQGDTADTYTLTVKNSGKAPTDGTVTLTDIVDPSIAWCRSAAPAGPATPPTTRPRCAPQTGRAGAVLQPGQSYPPITLTVQVPPAPAIGTQDSTDGLHVTNAVTVTGGASPAPPASSPPPDTDHRRARPHRRQHAGRRVPPGRATGRYEITVINHGRRPDKRQLVVADHRHDHRAAGGVDHPVAVRQRLDLQPGRDHQPRHRARQHLLPQRRAGRARTARSRRSSPSSASPITPLPPAARPSEVSGGGDAAAPASSSAAVTVGQSARPDGGQLAYGQTSPRVTPPIPTR